MVYEIVRYTPSDRDEVLELQTHLWGPDLDFNAARLRWKYERNPYEDTPHLYLARSGGRLVAMRGMVGACWQVGSQRPPLLAPCAADLVVLPEHRNRGLVERIMTSALQDLAARGYSHLFSFSGGLATQLGSLTMGWRSCGSIQTAHRRSDRAARSSRLRARLAEIALVRRVKPVLQRLASAWRTTRSPFADLDLHGGSGTARLDGSVSVERRPRAAAMADLVASIGPGDRLRHLRDRDYFDWRFDEPGSDYRFLYWEDTELRGYLVLQTPTASRSHRVNIVDWEASSPRVQADLLDTALQWGAFDHLAIWHQSLSVEAREHLRASGFSSAPDRVSIGRAHRTGLWRETLLARALDPATLDQPEWRLAGRSLTDLTSWDLRMLYSDAY
jgi:hypothetical protein